MHGNVNQKLIELDHPIALEHCPTCPKPSTLPFTRHLYRRNDQLPIPERKFGLHTLAVSLIVIPMGNPSRSRPEIPGDGRPG